MSSNAETPLPNEKAETPAKTPPRSPGLWLGRGLRLAAALGLVLLGAGATQLFPGTKPAPTVFALLQVQVPEPLLEERGSCLTPRDAAAVRHSHALAIRSRPVLLSALKKDEIKQVAFLQRLPDPAAWLEANLQVDFPEDGELLRLGLSGSDAPALATVVNAVADAYLADFAHAEQAAQVQRVMELEKARTEHCDLLQSQQIHLDKLERSLGIPSPARLHFLSRQAEDCDRELRRVRLARRAAEARPRAAAAGGDGALEAQEKLLAEELVQLTLELDRGREGIELQALRDQIKSTREVCDQLRRRLAVCQLELRQRPRVRKFADAGAF